MDARRRVVTLQNAPQVLFRNDAPLELQGVPGLLTAGEGEISYVTFGMGIRIDSGTYWMSLTCV